MKYLPISHIIAMMLLGSMISSASAYWITDNKGIRIAEVSIEKMGFDHKLHIKIKSRIPLELQKALYAHGIVG